MRRFLAEGIRVLSLVLLTLVAFWAMFWSGTTLFALLGNGTDALTWLWFGSVLGLGAVLFVAAVQLWRGQGSVLLAARRGLLALALLGVVDALQPQITGQPTQGVVVVGLPAFFVWLAFVLVQKTPLRHVVAYDRIALKADAIDRLDDLL